ncbi:wall-associated receptor kinase-like protein 2 [Tanacetum coccineum]|uniref:Wall-associated receptor kinase-like protein 2 n=1 Tax=Tanacetum coccineum TaxID=301880 RepID=A0ABQ5EK73_9ASTR
MCGNISIPYPFGIEPNCYLNKSYAVNCTSSKPYLSSLKNLPLLSIDLYEQMVLVNVPMSSECQTSGSNRVLNVDLGDTNTPFLFSKSHNKFIVKGCGQVTISSGGNVLMECSTTCSHQSLTATGKTCETDVPFYLKTYSVNLTNSGTQTGHKSCLSAFMVASKSYIGQSVDTDTSMVPVVLRWTLPNDFSEASCGYNLTKHELKTNDNSSVITAKCNCWSELEEGNPYVLGGCQVTEVCTKCIDKWGVCGYKVSYGGVRNYFCDTHFHNGGSKASSRAVFIGVGISGVVLTITAIGFASYKVIQKAKNKRQRRMFFERNGGLLLTQQEASNEGLVDKTKLFTSDELEKATDHFNENRILGRGGQGTVYKGMLTDGRIVAVKKSKAVDQSQLEQFINEVVILSQVNHRNVVKLLGCCLETDVPLLVSEFIPNGTLYKHIHDQTSELFISLNMRLQIATDVAGALSYLHSATSIPIYHRDIKSTNILLDEKFRAKISDFGTSRFVSISQTHLTTLVQGTIGYLDPEYFQSSQITEKSDVYSFGVVLVELITSEKPICLTRFGGNRSLDVKCLMEMTNDLTRRNKEKLEIRTGIIETGGFNLSLDCSWSLLILVLARIKRTRTSPTHQVFSTTNGRDTSQNRKETREKKGNGVRLISKQVVPSQPKPNPRRERKILIRIKLAPCHMIWALERNCPPLSRRVAVQYKKIALLARTRSQKLQREDMCQGKVLATLLKHKHEVFETCKVFKAEGEEVETATRKEDLSILNRSAGGLKAALSYIWDIDRTEETFSPAVGLSMYAVKGAQGHRCGVCSKTCGQSVINRIGDAPLVPWQSDKDDTKVSDGLCPLLSMEEQCLQMGSSLDRKFVMDLGVMPSLSKITEKSDVYSFGVVLVELITSEKPICLTRFGGNRSLATHFITAFEEGRVMSILDAKMVRYGNRDVLLETANLAMRCLNLYGKNRPTMKEVATDLERIRMSHMPSIVQSDYEKVKYNAGEEELLMLSYGASTSSSIIYS